MKAASGEMIGFARHITLNTAEAPKGKVAI